MRAVIVGCGRVGAELADALGHRGFSVSVIDKRATSFERLHPSFKGETFIGPGFDRELLEKAGIREARVFMAVTNGDNSNIVSARIAKEHYHVPYVAARIYDPRRAKIYERLGIPTVATVAWTTDQIMARVLPVTESLEWTIGSGEVVVSGTQAPEEMIGKQMAALNVPGKVHVTAFTRFGQTFLPEPRSLIQEGDFLHLAVLRSYLGELEEHLKGTGQGGKR
ncbi:MAG: potassium channel family protein [Actinomycetota bacterium]